MPSPATYEVFLSPFALALLGLCVGSFLNVVIHRLPLMMMREWRLDAAELLGTPAAEDAASVSLASPASRCPACGHPIRWYENIPLVSWLVLRGRCSACQARISMRYPLVELLTGLLFAGAGWAVGAQPMVLLWCGFLAALVALALIDFDTQYLPDDINMPLLWAGIIAAGLGWLPIPLSASVAGAVVGYLSLWSIAKAFYLIRGKLGMAPGDFKLLAALGAWLGWQALPSIVLLSSAVGAVIGIALITLRSHDREVPLPFGPYLAGGGIAAFFFGEQLTRLWSVA